ncbi:flagellar basal body rod protein FlgC [Rhizobiales bacterium TNE-4]|nr:flagellar basal body rod protein FlgC [Rhizobiales bacterium TNE-4]MBV1828817.1 flagellar basal body rod protein FlgC [Rhizobiales bacterium TNE-4]
MELNRSIQTALSSLKLNDARMRIAAENIANASSTAQTPNGEPYRRKFVVMESRQDQETGASLVRVGRVMRDRGQFSTRHEPGHPAADANGYVKYPNVDTLVEQVDVREAQRAYEASLYVITSARALLARTIGLLRE